MEKKAKKSIQDLNRGSQSSGTIQNDTRSRSVSSAVEKTEVSKEKMKLIEELFNENRELMEWLKDK